MKLSDKLKQGGLPTERTTPLWEGPNGNGEQGGISFSMLSRFLVCRDRFKALVVNGLRPKDKFDSKLEFGHFWHIHEEEWAKPEGGRFDRIKDRMAKLIAELTIKFPFDVDQICHWADMAAALFPRYAEWWVEHPDETARRPLCQEENFSVRYHLPSGRMVRLRGRWDGLTLTGKGKDVKVFVCENKTKSSIDRSKLQRQLRWDLQTMIYCLAVLEHQDESFWRRANKGWWNAWLGGVKYNVVRRPAHKSTDSMLKKVEDDRRAGRSGEWFDRWDVLLTKNDVKKFCQVTLDPVLENLCYWWEFQNGVETDYPYPPPHWRHPFGVYNVLDEGGATELDEWLESGSTAGLQVVDDLFRELR